MSDCRSRAQVSAIDRLTTEPMIGWSASIKTPRPFLDRFADRALDRRLEGASQFLAAIGAEGDRFREDAGDFVRALLLVVEPVVEFAQLLLLRPDDQPAQFRQVVQRFSRRGRIDDAHPKRMEWKNNLSCCRSLFRIPSASASGTPEPEFVFQPERHLGQHLRERFPSGHGVADLPRFVLEMPFHLVVFFLHLGAEGFRLFEQLLAQVANVFRRLAVEIADLQLQTLTVSPISRASCWIACPRSDCSRLDPVGHRFRFAFHEGLQGLQLTLQFAPQLARLPRQALLQFLETAVVIAHLRSEKDVANAIDIAALVDRAIFLPGCRVIVILRVHSLILGFAECRRGTRFDAAHRRQISRVEGKIILQARAAASQL